MKFVSINVSGNVEGKWIKICNLGADYATESGGFQINTNINRTTMGMIRVLSNGDLEAYANAKTSAVSGSVAYF